jgi:hypothetical protein
MAIKSSGLAVGAGLKVDQSPEARALSLALCAYLRKIQSVAGGVAAGTKKTLATVKNDSLVYLTASTETNAPASNTAADSPEQGPAFIWDTYNNDLYFVNTWSATGTFNVVLCQT